jgi:hypothetical protein
MEISMRLCLRFFALKILLITSACFDAGILSPSSGPGRISDEWIVLGNIADPQFYPKEILALGADGTRYRTSINADLSFSLQLPGNSLYAFYVVPDPTKTALPAAILTFDDGRFMDQSDILRLPKPTLNALLDLGSLDIENGQAFPTRNPSRILDFDEDGLVDIFDPEDQNDGLNDNEQKWENQKVGICHKEKRHKKLMFVQLSTLLIHLQHGDIVGSCGN